MAGGGTHDRDELARRDRGRSRRRDVRVHVADGHRDALRQARPGGRARGQRASPRAQGQDRMLQLVGRKASEPLIKRGQELARRVAAVLPDPLVPGRGGVACLAAGQLPDDPVGGLDPALGLLVDLRILVQQLERLRELPLGGYLAAVAGDPWLAAGPGQRIDPVGLRLGGMVLPQLGVGVRAAAQPGEPAQRGAIGQHRQYRAGGEVGADPDHLRRVDAGVGDRRRDGLAQDVTVIFGILQCPVRGQRLAGRGEYLVHHAVPVLVHRGAELCPVTDPDHQGPPGQRAEIDSDDAVLGAVRTNVSAHNDHSH